MENCAPILLFTYKRLDTLKLTVDALSANTLASKSDLYIFSDAEKKPEDSHLIRDVRSYLKTIQGFKSITIFEAPTNQGLANSIIHGVSKLFQLHDSLIVLEDDLITTPNFLSFLNQSLHFYSSKKSVFSISGYSFNLNINNSIVHDAYFLNRGWSWGWATWKDRWHNVDWEVTTYQSFIKDSKARSIFAQGGSDLNSMLDKQMSGQLDSWAIRWFYHQFLIGGLTLYPTTSKVLNEGFDTNATHTTGSNTRYLPNLDSGIKENFIFPENVSVNSFYQLQFQKKLGYTARIKSKLETLLSKFTLF